MGEFLEQASQQEFTGQRRDPVDAELGEPPRRFGLSKTLRGGAQGFKGLLGA